MINLFNPPVAQIDTSKYSNLLHDKIVTQFEEEFADYVGAKYACSFNSATNAIFALLDGNTYTVVAPSILPHVVANAVVTSDVSIRFEDNIDWVGGSYRLHHNIIDSAQRVDRNQFSEATEYDSMVFSFYPTKPVGGCDGGMVVSNNKSLIDRLKIYTMNGTSKEHNNWERTIHGVGYKMYMNSIQADIALQSLRKLDEKKDKLARVRYLYNKHWVLHNTSDHLYRLRVKDNQEVIKRAAEAGIVCGIHYRALHTNPIYMCTSQVLPKSERESTQTISIPFHENLTSKDIRYVCDTIDSICRE